MPTKKSNKSKNEVKKTPAATAAKPREHEMFEAMLASFRAATTSQPSPIDKRKELLALVAGAVAAGLATAPSPSITTASIMATAAVDIANEILNQSGIPAVDESSEESSLPHDDVDAGAA